MTLHGLAGAHGPLRFVVLQPGARRHYSVPALLARAGMLERFYTDLCADVGLLRYLGPLWPGRLRPKPIARLFGRRLPSELPRSSVRHSPVHALAGGLVNCLPTAAPRLRQRLEPSLRLMRMVRADGYAGANALYTSIVNADLDLVREARDRGLRVVHEAFMDPLIGLIIQDEREMWPGVEEQVPKDRPEFRGPAYLGQVPRSRIMGEFRGADVFVLPTLCEGMARVQLEAMACGVPVITTPNSGSVVRDGVDGFIVPIRDAAAIADRIEQLLSDRELREQMGRSARERAREFSWDRYGERLIDALSRLA